ncbi:hypothetical protein Y032_0018g3597 [Ancylostoma ceylanicum]|uniref:Uncharacterized protein n=1 Tax=Ancylostoma ceylanicum TaxID=53326 RepID=A0A016V596_9BILA|nr:hypothetical protein Y032_0018g3597 [Ancylostoma ceylanicum]
MKATLTVFGKKIRRRLWSQAKEWNIETRDARISKGMLSMILCEWMYVRGRCSTQLRVCMSHERCIFINQGKLAHSTVRLIVAAFSALSKRGECTCEAMSEELTEYYEIH